ncbi:MAG: aminotransferase class I/II-fold pyridoxal phosphate-dependent enzyme, partial [SAR324 cluster bacterium]|nr:aminotransferase class I/II-fold pyridoxal phosphate-dependent enzyme [SAR324 cluster bacterium]
MSKIDISNLLSDRMAQLPEYMFEKLNIIRLQKRQAGQDLVDMAMGNPKDPTPQPIVDKLIEVVQDPRNHRYSVATGIYSLRKELSRYYGSQFGVQLDPDKEVICTIGSKEGFSHLCLALLGAGDRAIVPAPSYPIHTYSVILAGGEALRLSVEDDEAMLRDLVAMCKKLSPAPKVLFLNYPHNPTGKCVELPFFEEVVKIAKRHRLIVVHDFAYSRITFDGYEAPSFLQAKGAMDVGCEFGTMSKAYNMAGWRVGYALGNREIIGALNRIKGYYDYG